jgi:hypothetical protein
MLKLLTSPASPSSWTLEVKVVKAARVPRVAAQAQKVDREEQAQKVAQARKVAREEQAQKVAQARKADREEQAQKVAQARKVVKEVPARRGAKAVMKNASLTAAVRAAVRMAAVANVVRAAGMVRFAIQANACLMNVLLAHLTARAIAWTSCPTPSIAALVEARVWLNGLRPGPRADSNLSMPTFCLCALMRSALSFARSQISRPTGC